MTERYEKSCGAVVFTRTERGIEFVIVQSLEGYYGFPKGHCEAGETEEETALREIREETGLNVCLIPGVRYVDVYPIPQKPGVLKQVVYFLAAYGEQNLQYQQERTKTILRKANDYISKMEINHV